MGPAIQYRVIRGLSWFYELLSLHKGMTVVGGWWWKGGRAYFVGEDGKLGRLISSTEMWKALVSGLSNGRDPMVPNIHRKHICESFLCLLHFCFFWLGGRGLGIAEDIIQP
jgi:hypothetical protein